LTALLNGKIALVTGSTRGIGLEIARQLAKQGCRLMLNGVDPPSVVETAMTELRAEGTEEVIFSDADLANPTQAARLISDTLDSFGAIDILVNNAGIQRVAPIEAFTDEDWDRIIEINLSAPFRLIRQALPAMRANAWGRIINIASVHGLVASRHKSAYVAAKHGLVGLTKTVALETAVEPITCNAVCPGYVQTALIESQTKNRPWPKALVQKKQLNRLLAKSNPQRLLLRRPISVPWSFFCVPRIARRSPVLCSPSMAVGPRNNLVISGCSRFLLCIRFLNCSPGNFHWFLFNLSVPFEDSRNGVLSAKGAGLRVLTTLSGYTAGDDLSGSNWVFDRLGDPQAQRIIFSN